MAIRALARCPTDLPFRTRPISEAYLDEHVRYDMQLMRESGMKIIPRFVYNWNVEDYDPSDAPVEWTLAHLDQLAPILRANYDVISHLEAGFVELLDEGGDQTPARVAPLTTWPTAATRSSSFTKTRSGLGP